MLKAAQNTHPQNEYDKRNDRISVGGDWIVKLPTPYECTRQNKICVGQEEGGEGNKYEKRTHHHVA